MGACLWIAECDIADETERMCIPLMGESELTRHRRIRYPLRQRQFLLGRLMLREMLARRFSEDIKNWPLVEQPGQAPRLMRSLPSPAAFSIAHSHNRVACLVAEGHRAGCDIEFIGKVRDIHRIAASMFDAELTLALAQQQKGSQQEFFHRAWTRHEAVFKHGGSGLALLTTALDGNYCISLALEKVQDRTAYYVRWESGQAIASSIALEWD